LANGGPGTPGPYGGRSDRAGGFCETVYSIMMTKRASHWAAKRMSVR